MHLDHKSINLLLVAFTISASSINASPDDKVFRQEVMLPDVMSAVGVSLQKVGITMEPATRLYMESIVVGPEGTKREIVWRSNAEVTNLDLLLVIDARDRAHSNVKPSYRILLTGYDTEKHRSPQGMRYELPELTPEYIVPLEQNRSYGVGTRFPAEYKWGSQNGENALVILSQKLSGDVQPVSRKLVLRKGKGNE